MKKLVKLASLLLALTGLCLISCSQPSAPGDRTFTSTDPKDLRNTTWLWEKNDSEEQECTNTHYEKPTEPGSSGGTVTYTFERKPYEITREEKTTKYYLHFTNDKVYFGTCTYSRTIKETKTSVYKVTSPNSEGQWYADENETITELNAGPKTYTPLYKGDFNPSGSSFVIQFSSKYQPSTQKWEEVLDPNASYDKTSDVGLYQPGSKTPNTLTSKIQGSTLELTYNTETKECGKPLDAQGTKCTTQLTKRFFSKWNKTDFDSVMIGSDTIDNPGDSGNTPGASQDERLVGSWSGTSQQSGANIQITLKSGGGGFYVYSTTSDPYSPDWKDISWSSSGDQVTISGGISATGTITTISSSQPSYMMTLSINNESIRFTKSSSSD